MRSWSGRARATTAVLALAVAATGTALAGSLSGNQSAARHDARSLVAKLRLPAGAAEVGAEPAGDHGYLAPGGALEGDRARAMAHAWWTLTGSPTAVLTYVRAHHPAGATLTGTSTAGDVAAGSGAASLVYQWPAVAGVLGNRELEVTATALPNARTGVLAESQSDWIVPRPAGERIPATTREIDITSGLPGRPPSLKLSVTTAVKVNGVVSAINGLPIAQPVVYACPLLVDPLVITMTFRATPKGAALAVLTYDDYRPWWAPSGACKTVQLTIGASRQDPLIGGSFLSTIGALLGRSLI